MTALFTRRSAITTTSVVVEREAGMRDYLITIATATLAAMLLQVGSPPACADVRSSPDAAHAR